MINLQERIFCWTGGSNPRPTTAHFSLVNLFFWHYLCEYVLKFAANKTRWGCQCRPCYEIRPHCGTRPLCESYIRHIMPKGRVDYWFFLHLMWRNTKYIRNNNAKPSDVLLKIRIMQISQHLTKQNFGVTSHINLSSITFLDKLCLKYKKVKKCYFYLKRNFIQIYVIWCWFIHVITCRFIYM